MKYFFYFVKISLLRVQDIDVDQQKKSDKSQI